MASTKAKFANTVNPCHPADANANSIYMHLDIQFDQNLCDVLHAELGLVCSFMDEAGRIVASSERERIGHTHPVAQRIMQGELDEYSVTAEEAARSATVREGINMGIDLGGQRVVCFAIAGPLEVVTPLARFVRFCVISLLQVRQDGSAVSVPPATATATATGKSHQNNGPNAPLTDLLGHASQAVALSLNRLHDAVDHIDQGITLFDRDLRLVVWNRRFLELIGVPETVVRQGQPLEELVWSYAESAGYFPADLQTQVSRRVSRARAGQPGGFEHVSPQGTVLAIVDRPLPDGSLVSTYTDITEKYQANIALHAAYETAGREVELGTRTLTDFSNLSSDWFWEQDAEFRFTRFFGHSMDKLRREPDYFVGKRRWDLPIHVSAQQLAGHIACHERHEPFRHFEYEIEGEDGNTQYFSVSGTPRFDDKGRFTGYHGTGSDITDLRRAELAIRERERQLAQIVDGSPLATFVVDARQRITHWNRACTAMTGRDPTMMVGHHEAGDAWYGSSKPTLANLLVDQATEKALAIHYPDCRPSTLMAGALEAEVFLPGMRRWLHITAAPLRDAQGKLTGAIETVQDVTERRRDQHLLEERSAALQQANLVMEQRVQERTEELSQQLNFMRQLIDAIPSPVFYKDAQLRYLGCNSAFETFTGKPAAELIGKTPLGFAPAALAEKYAAADHELVERRGKQIYESEMLRADGKLRQMLFHKATFTHPDGSLGGLVGIMLDITERTRMENDLRQAAAVFDNIAEGVAISDHGGTIVAVNQAFTTITGYDRAEAIGQNPRLLQSGRHDRKFYRDMWDAITSSGRWQGEIWNRRKSGDIYPQWLSITTVDAPQGQPIHYVATFSDITHQKQNEERIQQLAFSDPLTGLPNRRLLLDRLEHALIVSARNQRRGALFFIDLDDFKGLNDTRGHYMGDLLLQQVAQRLVGCVREGDTVARLGGDEFVVMLEGLSQDALAAVKQAEAVGAQLLLTLNEPYTLQDGVHHNTASIGVALFGEPQGSVDDLLKQADLAMYRAKASGRNALCFFDPQMQSVLAERVALENELRLALQRQEFILHYQPQVNQAGALMGVEALVRWQHPERALVSPLDFIPLAEETGLILPLGHWVLETACRQLAVWALRPEREPLTMAVNVSARQFHHVDFVEQVLTILEQTGANPGRLKLELTESLLIANIEEVIAKMSTLKARGVCFSLDDFGTGYSSLSYLKRLPLDQLKIDQGFVSHVLTDSNDAAIARMIVALSESLGLEVIAEGVEQAEQRDFLALHGCYLYQGYFFSRPLPINALEDYADSCQAALALAARAAL